MSRTKFILFSLLLGGQLFLVFSFLHYQEYFKNWNLQLDPDEYRPASAENVTQVLGNQGVLLRTWNLAREVMLSEGENPRMSKPTQDFLLSLRKLVLFSVREVNQRISGEGCGKWWVNPLSVHRLEKRFLNAGVMAFRLSFRIQPGNIPFETNVLTVERGGDRVAPGTHLVYLNGTRLDELPKECGPVREELRIVCLCPEEVREAEKVTSRLRHEWGQTDPELFSWPPHVPMFVSDYIPLGDARLYLKSPSNKTDYCDPAVKMIVFISSAPTHSRERETIRKTFGNPQYLHPMGARLLFLFGKITSQTLQVTYSGKY